MSNRLAALHESAAKVIFFHYVDNKAHQISFLCLCPMPHALIELIMQLVDFHHSDENGRIQTHFDVL
jgi:hypothetical protein